jgi:hypothetical protein
MNTGGYFPVGGAYILQLHDVILRLRKHRAILIILLMSSWYEA